MSKLPTKIAGTDIYDPATVSVAPIIQPDSGQTPAGQADPKLQNALMQIIHPSVRDRWMTGLMSTYTPQLIENTIRGAMSGNLMSIWLMFDLMERTWPRLSKNLNELKTAVISMGWNLQPFALKGDKPTPEAQRRKRIIEQMLWTMRPDLERDENDFEDTLRDIMDAVGKGVSLLQVDYELRAVNASMDPKVVQLQKLWCPRATQWVHPRYYGYPSGGGGGNSDDRLMLNAREIKQNNPNVVLEAVEGVWAEIPKDRFIVSIFKQKSGHPLGGALLSILGYWWAAQNFTWDWFLNFSQIFGVPIRWATYAPGVQQQTITQILDMLRQMGNLSYAAFPQGTNLELKTGATDARNVPHKVLIDAADTICDVLILGQTLTTTQGDRGSQSLGTVHADIRREKIGGIATRSARMINLQLIPALCRLNFGDDSECPQLVPADTKGKDALAVANRYKVILSTPGVVVSKDQYYRENDLVVPDDDDEVLVASSATATDLPPGGGGDEGGAGQEDLPSELETAEARRGHRGCAHADATAAVTERLITNTLREIAPVEVKWLGGVRPFFRELIAKAQDETVSDADFVRALAKASRSMPELFEKIKPAELQTAMENAFGSAFANGAVRGHLARKQKTESGKRKEVVA
jgi:phage gp29-like protein